MAARLKPNIPAMMLLGNTSQALLNSRVAELKNLQKEIAEQNELTEIDSVTLELGEVSGVVSDYLKDCWAWYAKKTPLIQNASLEFETIPAITWCNACKTTYPTVQYGKTCPNCGSGETWLQQGNEMNIKQIVAC